MTECIKCQNLDLRGDERMTSVGFSLCKKRPSYEFVSIKRDIKCEDYREDMSKLIEKRIEWRNQRDSKK